MVARCEIDSHADCCVAVPNFQTDEYTGKHCDVSSYSNEYKPINDAPIVNVSTAFTDEKTGETMILQFNQILWYGKKLSMSFINPNQLRHYGLTASYHPTYKTREFGITGDDFVIPFGMEEATIFFKLRVPTQWERENCCVIEMTDDNPWSPAEVNIAHVRVLPSMKQTTYRQICAVEGIEKPKITVGVKYLDSDLSKKSEYKYCVCS